MDVTKISQSTIDSADTFPAVFTRFTEWLRKHDLRPESTLFVVDNRWDVGEMLVKQLALCGLTAPTDTVSFKK